MKTEKVRLTDLILDFDLYPRNEISSTHVTTLMDAIQAGQKLPPAIVDRKSKRVVDGFHRQRAYERLGIEETEVIFRDYESEAALYADAVSLNAAHGRAFDNYDRRRAVLRLADLGFTPEQISEIAKVPLPRIEEIRRITATVPGGRIEIVKGGLRAELVGKRLTKPQQELNASWGGMQPAYHARQLLEMLRAGVIPESETFHVLMNDLTAAWSAIVRRRGVRKAS